MVPLNVTQDQGRELSLSEFAEFAVLVTTQLPRNLGHRAEWWKKHPGDLAYALRQALFPPKLNYIHQESCLWQVEVDYGQSLEELAVAGNYHWMIDMPSNYYRTLQSGKKNRTFRTVQFGMDQQLTTEQVVSKLAAIKMRPAETHELLALAAKYQDFPGYSEILAAGYHWQCKWQGEPYIPFISGRRHGVHFCRSFCWYTDRPDTRWEFGRKFLATHVDE